MTPPCRHRQLAGRAGSALLGLMLMAHGLATPAVAESPFTALGGNWSGSGQVRFTGGATEAVKCRAYYTPKDAGASLGLAILCASPSSKIELRATLNYQGGSVAGRWEERTYNAQGEVKGQASGSKLSLAIAGGGFSGSMAVGLAGGRQTVTISTEGIGMAGVSINLSRG